MMKCWAFGISFIVSIAGIILAQGISGGLTSGAEIYRSACTACHGADGRGAPDSLRGFEKPDTFPDFTACVATARESNDFWGAIIHNGGPGRGFSEIMPSFHEALTDDQIVKVMDYLRHFCREPSWPRGEMNLPRPLVTEKAFPEDEMVMDVAINAEGDAAITDKVVYEKRLGARGQLDVVMPFKFHKPGGSDWESGVGDLVAGYKHVLLSNLRTGSVFSLAGETIFATGNSERGMGKGVTVFEGFASYGQLLPKNAFLHFQSGIELPTDTDLANRAVFESGAVKPEGAIAGNDNDMDATRFEPHYSEIRDAGQVQIYEAIMADSNGKVTTGLLHAVRYLKDNRVLPRGFDKRTAGADIAVAGEASGDADYIGGSDRIRYSIELGDAPGPFHVEAGLYYQPISYCWALNLKGYDAEEPKRFARYYEAAASSSAILLARAQAESH